MENTRSGKCSSECPNDCQFAISNICLHPAMIKPPMTPSPSMALLSHVVVRRLESGISAPPTHQVPKPQTVSGRRAMPAMDIQHPLGIHFAKSHSTTRLLVGTEACVRIVMPPPAQFETILSNSWCVQVLLLVRPLTFRLRSSVCLCVRSSSRESASESTTGIPP